MIDTNDLRANKVYKWQDATLTEEVTPLTLRDDRDTIPVTSYTSHNGSTPQSFQQSNSNAGPQVDQSSIGVPIFNRYEPLQQEEYYASDAYSQQDYGNH